MDEGSLKHELEATVRARQEMGAELEPQLVEQFVDKIEEEIERRAKDLAAARQPHHNAPMIPLALGSLGLAIPLMGIAGALGGVAGIIAICIAIVLVNLLWVTRR